jgi:hypothetical protein
MSEQKELLIQVLDKLMSAGWIQAHKVNDAKLGENPAHGVGIAWTKLGQERVSNLLSLISEIENASTPMSDDEWKYLKAIARYSADQGDDGDNPIKR